MPTSIKFFIFLLLPCLLIACDNARKDQFVKHAQKAIEDGDYSKAQQALEQALIIDPDDVQNTFELAEALSKQGKLQAAFNQYQKVLEKDAGHVVAYLRMGQFLLMSRQFDQAQQMAEKAFAIDAEHTDVLVLMGSIKAAKNNSEAAIVDFEKVLKKHPDHVNATLSLATIYVRTGKVSQAIQLVEKNLPKHPENTTLRVFIADMHVRNNAFDSAEKMLMKVIELEPDILVHRERLARLFIKTGNKDKAEQVLRTAAEQLPNEEKARLMLIEFLAVTHGEEVAMAELIPMLGKMPGAYGLRFKLVELQLVLKQLQKAEQSLDEIINDSNAPEHVNKARNLLSKIYLASKRTKKALDINKLVLDNDAENIDALMLRGEMLLTQQKIVDAIAHFRIVLAKQPNNIKALKLLAASHIENNDPVLATENLDKVLTIAPEDVTARLQLANLLYQTKAYSEALQQTATVLKSKPNLKQGLETLFRIYIAQEQWENGQRVAKRMQEAYPKEADGYYMAGAGLQAAGKFKESIKSFKSALKVQPTSIEPLTQMVNSFLALKKPDSAIRELKGLIKKHPSHIVANNLLGDLYTSKEYYKDALNAYKNAVDLKPDWALPYKKLALINLARKKTNQAIEWYKKGIEKTNGNFDLVGGLAQLYENSGNFEQAIALLETSFMQQPDSPRIANNLALLLSEYGKDKGSLNRAASLVEPYADSENPGILDTVGWVAYKMGDYSKAQEFLKKTLAIQPDIPSFNYHLGMTYLKQGDKKSAQKLLQKAIAGNAQFYGIDEARRVLEEINNG